MQTATDLRNLLARIDRKGYPAYKDTKGAYQFPDYVLSIDHVQGCLLYTSNILPDHTDQSRPAGEAPAIVALPLEDAPKSLHGAVVRTLSHPGHALSDARRRQFVMENLGGIGTAPVTVEHGVDAGICF